MLRYIIVLLLLTTILSVKLAYSGTKTKIAYPPNAKTVLATKLNSHNTYKKLIPGASWIWDTNGINSPKNDYIRVRIVFRAKCRNTMTLRIAAYGNWSVQWNGKYVKKSSVFSSVSKVLLRPVKCGLQVLNIRVKKTIKNDWAGLIYRLDQSSCKCPPSKWLNPKNCRCECISKCSCPS